MSKSIPKLQSNILANKIIKSIDLKDQLLKGSKG